MKIYYLVTAPGTKQISISEKLIDARQISHEWWLKGFNPEIEEVKEEEMTEKEKEWAGIEG
jgi:hypothetical protein